MTAFIFDFDVMYFAKGIRTKEFCKLSFSTEYLEVQSNCIAVNNIDENLITAFILKSG